MLSPVPLTVMVRVLLTREKATLTFPEIDTPVTPPPSETWPLKLPAVMWKLVSVSVADPPVTSTRPLPREMARLLRLRLPEPLLEMVPTMVPETETGPKVSLKVVLTPALMVNWPGPKVTLMLAGPTPPVSVPLRPEAATDRFPLMVAGPDAPATDIFATATLIAPLWESRVKVRSPERVCPPIVSWMPVPATVTPDASRVTVTAPLRVNPVSPLPMLMLPLAVPRTTVVPAVAPEAMVKLAAPPVTF